MAAPASIQPGGAPPAQNKWQRWVFLGVGLVFVLLGLRQFGLIGGAPIRSSAPATGAAAPAARASAPATGAPTIVGRWAPDSSCTGLTTVDADGVFRGPDGSYGLWRLEGDVFTVTTDQGANTARLVAMSRNSITLLFSDGARETQVRC